VKMFPGRRCSCGVCHNGIGKQYYLGFNKINEGETVYLRYYWVCSECVSSVNKNAIIEANDHGEIQEKYFDEILSAFVKNETSKHKHILIHSEEGRDELRRAGCL